jgi:beta-xylosidase
VIDSVKFWNEPNNKSHWNYEYYDPEWRIFGEMIKRAADAVRSENPALTRVLGGISPIDPSFIQRLKEFGTLDHLDRVAVHGFPLDWNHWQLKEWPDKIKEIEAVTDLPVWVTEVGISTFGAEEVQEWGLRRTAELLIGRAERIHWYSLFDLPRTWEATTRHKEAEGSSYYRHFYLGLVREDGTEKPSYRAFADYAPRLGLCQWYNFEDPRLDESVRRFKELGVRHVRTGLSWADSYRPGWEDWFDRQMAALEPFDVTVTFCFTPTNVGLEPHHTSPPQDIDYFADFCARMVRRYAPGQTQHAAPAPTPQPLPVSV